MNDLKRYLDDKGRIKTWAAKKDLKAEILKYISTKFENGRFYTEKEVNRIIEDWHTFGDYFLIRRALIDNWLLSRTKSGSRYWKEEMEDYKDIIRLIEENYGIGTVQGFIRIFDNSRYNHFYILSEKGEYILKETAANDLSQLPDETLITLRSGDSTLKIDNKAYYLQNFY